MLPALKRINLITGHYGSGKTNLSINLALDAAASGKRVTLVDLDIVNPYFRAADGTELLESKGIKVITPLFANSNLDIPALPGEVYSVFADRHSTVFIDVGGDDVGARALGRYAKIIQLENNFEHFYVINASRMMTATPEETVEIMREIEQAGRIPVTAIVNNTHLSNLTTEETISSSISYAKKVAKLAELPLAFTSIREDLAEKFENSYPIKIYVKPMWEK